MENNEFNDIKVQNKYKIPLVVIIVLLLLLGGIGIYFAFSNSQNAKDVFDNAIDRVINIMVDNFNESKEILARNNKITSDISIKMSTDNAELKDISNNINKFNFKLDGEFNYFERIINGNIIASFDNEEVIDLGAYLNKDVAYFDLKDIYPKIIKTNLKLEDPECFNEECDYADNNFLEIINEDYFISIDTILKSNSKILKNILKEEYFVSKEEVIKNNGKEIKVTNHDLTLDSSALKEVLTNYLDALLDDEAFMEKVAKIENIDVPSLKEEIIESKENIDTENTNVQINIYMNRNKYIGARIIIKDIDSVITIEYNVDSKLIKVLEGDASICEITLEDNSIELNMTVDTANIKLLSEWNGLDKNDEKLTIQYLDKDNLLIKLVMETKLEEIDSLSKFDTTNEIAVENLTEEDMNTIMTNLMENEGIKKIMEIVNDAFNTLDALDTFNNLGPVDYEDDTQI